MISVCIATFNGSRYIAEQLDSILHQLAEGDEIIISDDGSTDGTLKIIREFNDERIKIYNHDKKFVKGNKTEKNIGFVSNNIQNAILHSKGQYVFLADQDDIWLDGRVKKCLDLFQVGNCDNQVIICDCKVVDSDKNIILHSYFSTIHTCDSILNTIIKNPYLGCCMCFDRALLSKLFPFPSYTIGHDLWLGVIGKLYGNVVFINEPLVLYRRHDMTVTKSSGKSTNSLWFKIKYRIMLCFILLKTYLNFR